MISTSCWLIDKDALRRQREEYAQQSDQAKIVRIRTTVESGLSASLMSGKQAITLRPNEKAPLILSVSNLSSKPQTFRVVRSASEVILSDCPMCDNPILVQGKKTIQVSMFVDIDWSSVDLRKDYILLPFQLVNVRKEGAAE